MEVDLRLNQALPTNGIYTLITFLSKEVCLNVGKLGRQEFPKGYYTYTGSALGKGSSSLEHRISRHLQTEKRNFWHIDFFLANENVTVKRVIVAQTNEKLECNLISYIRREEKEKILAKGFGASDCRANCGSHLLFCPDITEDPVLVQKIMNCYESLGLAPLPYCPCILPTRTYGIELLQKTQEKSDVGHRGAYATKLQKTV